MQPTCCLPEVWQPFPLLSIYFHIWLLRFGVFRSRNVILGTDHSIHLSFRVLTALIMDTFIKKSLLYTCHQRGINYRNLPRFCIRPWTCLFLNCIHLSVLMSLSLQKRFLTSVKVWLNKGVKIKDILRGNRELQRFMGLICLIWRQKVWFQGTAVKSDDDQKI